MDIKKLLANRMQLRAAFNLMRADRDGVLRQQVDAVTGEVWYDVTDVLTRQPLYRLSVTIDGTLCRDGEPVF